MGRVARARRTPSIYGFEKARTAIPDGAMPGYYARFATLQFSCDPYAGLSNIPERLLVWLRAKGRRYDQLKKGELKELKVF
jgi:hypothetical protein